MDLPEHFGKVPCPRQPGVLLLRRAAVGDRAAWIVQQGVAASDAFTDRFPPCFEGLAERLGLGAVRH
ncbi:hypothetical protein GCM10010508_16100 [Streptomyces naganishii JCM 4654]|uniref:Uncharacterized protein n=1 Tax=Streptomyces naganishii JCM 4654 TaxID=1306179 RepID=A0A918Y1Y2_9ACTN|nr:hypothetical protein GCM10010508_16100 [Streptomyces naganishii JCM 4654]